MKILRYAAMAILVIGVHITRAMSETEAMQALKNQEAILNATYGNGAYSIEKFRKVEKIAREVHRITAEFVNQHVTGIAPFDTESKFSAFGDSRDYQNTNLEKVLSSSDQAAEVAFGEIAYKVPENKRNEVDAVLKEARRIFKRCEMILLNQWYQEAF